MHKVTKVIKVVRDSVCFLLNSYIWDGHVTLLSMSIPKFFTCDDKGIDFTCGSVLGRVLEYTREIIPNYK